MSLSNKPLPCLVVYSANTLTATLSYQQGYPQQFAKHDKFKPVFVNLQDRLSSVRIRHALSLTFPRPQVIILLHSVFSNTNFLTGRSFDVIRKASQPKVYFIGNEYKNMPEKMAFCDDLNISLLVSQTSNEIVHKLYKNRLGCNVIGLPNSGIDFDNFPAGPPVQERPIDIGYRCFPGPEYLGHWEREDIATMTMDAAPKNMKLDISLDPNDRFDIKDWSKFLRSCKVQLGVEAGSDIFELNDENRLKINAIVDENSAISRNELEDHFPLHDLRMPFRCISSRIIEAIASKTPQILFRGEYDGYLQPDEHYIQLEKDGSNILEVLDQAQDGFELNKIADSAFNLAQEALSYQTLLNRLSNEIEQHL